MKRLCTLLFFIGATTILSAQYNVDYGFKIGGANYLGDIGGKEKTRRDFIWDMKLSQTRWATGGFVRYKFSPLISGNLGFTYLRIQGDDALSTNIGRRARNLSFRNDILDLSARGEIYVYGMNDLGNRGWYRTDLKAFVFAGVSGFYHNPKASNPNYNGGAWTALQPLQTEGVQYSKFGLSLPLGVGVSITHKRQHRFGWEIGWSTTFTDYLDDISVEYPAVSAVSDPSTYYYFTNRTGEVPESELPGGGADNYNPGQKRGDPTNNDVFMVTAFTYSYVVRGPNTFYRQHYSWINRGRRSKRKVRAKF